MSIQNAPKNSQWSRQVNHGSKRKLDQPNGEVRNRPPKKRHIDPEPEDVVDNSILDEIRALGGDEKDLDLIAAAQSDSEQEFGEDTAESNAPNLLRDVADFAKELGIFGVSNQNSVSFSDDAEDENEGNSEDESPGAEDHEDGSSDDSDDNNNLMQSQDDHKPTTKGPRQSQQVQPPSTDELRSKTWNTIVEPRPEWFKEPAIAGPKVETTTAERPDMALGINSNVVQALKLHGESQLQRDAQTYAASRNRSSAHKFISTIMVSGTMVDKVSALTLAIQESPLHNTKAIDSLINLAGKKSRSQALVALGALVDLFGHGLLLPSDRRLYRFASQPGLIAALKSQGVWKWEPGQPLPANLQLSSIICWVFEDWLKNAYFKIICLLETWTTDEVAHSRLRAVNFVYTLLCEKPEEESNLLRLLVHRLGDVEKQVASRTSYLILQLFEVHPAMKKIVIQFVRNEILLCPSQTPRALYYAIITLNQCVLSAKEPEVAQLLQEVYFSVFVTVLKQPATPKTEATPEPAKRKHKKRKTQGHKVKPGHGHQSEESTAGTDGHDKLISALLTGVNRAMPYANTDGTTLEGYLDTLFRIAHSSNFNTSIQALLLIQQISTSRGVLVDRFYRTLYESLLDPRLITSSKQTLYLNLIFKSMRIDTSVRRVKAFVKRLTQIAALHQPSFVCAVLYLITVLQKGFPDICVLVQEPESVEVDLSSDTRQYSGYDGRKRDPEFSDAHKSCLWELLPFLNHFHPSVAVYAADVISRKGGLARPDPASHTLIRFLDKFAFRNPKTKPTSRGISVMQPSASVVGTGNLFTSQKATAGVVGAIPVNDPSFWSKAAEHISVDDAFFHGYFSHSRKPAMDKKKKLLEAKKGLGQPGDAGNDADDSDAAEEDIWNALVAHGAEDAIDNDEFDEDDEDMLDAELSSESEGESGVALDGFDEADEDGNLSGPSDDGDGGDDSGDELDDADDDSEAGDTKPGDGGRPVAKLERAPSTETVAKAMRRPSTKKKMIKSLPIFASVDDYETLLGGDNDEDEDLGYGGP